MNNDIDYISSFGEISTLDRKILLNEMDKAWDTLGLNNKIPIARQMDTIAKFYNHPVWILNGLFSELDAISRRHRELIADQVANLKNSRIADYGGGKGVLAKMISNRCPTSEIEIIEPYIEHSSIGNIDQLSFKKTLENEYDIVIAQDVLEHVDEPIELALTIIKATKNGGHVIFANSFYPEIKCHLPSSFYLRYTFKKIMSYAGLNFLLAIKGAKHVHIYEKTSTINLTKVERAVRLAKIIGPVLNFSANVLAPSVRFIKSL